MNIDKTQPLVTVYMPTYNRVELLQRAVDSVLKQDYSNIELIVVDDNSTDSTHEYLARMAKEDSRLKYLINETNSGACVSRNKAIFAARGEFITGLDDDDFLLPSHIASFVNAWQHKKDDCIAFYCHVYTKKDSKLRKASKKVTHCSHSDLIASNWIGNQIFTKTQFLRQIGGFDERLPMWQDFECWYRLLESSNLQAYCSGEYSYVIDTSHDYERISTSKVKLATKTYQYFYKKHKLSQTQKEILRLQLNPYLKDAPQLQLIVKSLFYLPTRHNLVLSGKKLLYPRISSFLHR